MAGSLFVLALDPILNFMQRELVVQGFGQVAACADDVGAVIFRILHLVKLFEAFGPRRPLLAWCS
eukprot:6939316-Lingulodinium_polyedra.AAC.1